MKFEFAQTEEEMDALLDQQQETEQEEGTESERRPHPSALILAASERLRTRARADSDRLHESLTRMLYTVETSRAAEDASPEDPEQGSTLFRPEAFGRGPEGTANPSPHAQ